MCCAFTVTVVSDTLGFDLLAFCKELWGDQGWVEGYPNLWQEPARIAYQSTAQIRCKAQIQGPEQDHNVDPAYWLLAFKYAAGLHLALTRAGKESRMEQTGKPCPRHIIAEPGEIPDPQRACRAALAPLRQEEVDGDT